MEQKFSRREIREIEGNRYISWTRDRFKLFSMKKSFAIFLFFFSSFFLSIIESGIRDNSSLRIGQDGTFLTIRNGRPRYSGQTFQLAGTGCR